MEEEKIEVLKAVEAFLTGMASEEDFILDKDKVRQRNHSFLKASLMDVLSELLSETDETVKDENIDYEFSIRTIQGFGIVLRDYILFHFKMKDKSIEGLRNALKYHNLKPIHPSNPKSKFKDLKEYNKEYKRWSKRFEDLKKNVLKQTS